MTLEEIKKRFNETDDEDLIYATLYGDSCEGENRPMIFAYKKNTLNAVDDKKFVCSFIGPLKEANEWLFEDYGKTWAFVEEDFVGPIKRIFLERMGL